jgi:hypothetical protein
MLDTAVQLASHAASDGDELYEQWVRGDLGIAEEVLEESFGTTYWTAGCATSPTGAGSQRGPRR